MDYACLPAQKTDSQQLMNNLIGVSVAMVGVVLYGHLKHASGTTSPDCLDMVCPGCLMNLIEPRSAENDEERQGLRSGP